MRTIESTRWWNLARVSVAFLALMGVSGLQAQDPPATDSGKMRLQFPNNSVDDVLGVYELLTGKAVVKDTEIFDGPKISLVTATEVSLAEAIKLIESALQSNGYIIVPETDGSAVRVLTNDANLATVSEGLKVIMDVSELPAGRQLASFFLPLEHLDPLEASIVFSTHVGLNDYGRLTPVTRPRGLLITENSALIRHFVKLREVLDAPQGGLEKETKFYELEFAESSVLAEILNATFETRQTPPTLTDDTMGDNRSILPKRTQKATVPQVVADGRLNRLMVVASEEDHAFVAKVVEEFDRPIELEQPYERGLKYVFVDEVLPVLVDLLQDTGTGVSSLPGGGSVRTRIPPQASTEASTLTGRVRRGVQRREEASTQIGGRADTLLDPSEDNAPISVLVGKTRIIADMQANNLLVLGPKPDVEKIDQMLDRLDRKPPQVYLATVIGQLTLDDGLEIGVDYVRKFMETGDGGYAGSLITTDGELAGAVGALTANPAVGPAISALEGFSFFGRVQDDLDILVRAMETTGRFKVLSRPSVFAANNKKAVIASGTRIPVPTSSITDLGDSDNVRTNIDFQDVVLKLEVVPLINKDKEVSLTIAQVNDSVVGQQRVAEDTIPIIGTEQLTTTVTVANRTTIVLGGLITETEEEVESGLPYVSRIPVLGNAFKNRSNKTTRKELLIFIQPVVVDGDEELVGASMAEDGRTGIGWDAFKKFPPAPVIVPGGQGTATGRGARVAE